MAYKHKKHWLCLIAPQHPKNPITRMHAPPTSNTMAADYNSPMTSKFELAAPILVTAPFNILITAP
ncbi:hypothetical protein DPMN_015820 [Dreissena polymorpha]|uniref:Uncharacterized protein n=1 Tax=Dreissena polymorpha TaxID=45954 RepID=A0A9D4NDD0_DREPO|nr:hypothetical protein DPMN_015820 [Dreissena polymorpha]